MIRINLLPPERRRAAPGVRLILPWRTIVLGGLAVLGVYSGGLLIATRVQAHTAARLSTEWTGLQPQRTQLETTQGLLRALQDQAQMSQVMKAPSAQWAPRLNALSDALVAQLWFTELTYGPPEEKTPRPPPPPKGVRPLPAASAAPVVLLSGTALVTADQGAAPVSRYLQRLKESSEFTRLFRGVELKDVQHHQVGQEDVSDFVMVLYPAGL